MDVTQVGSARLRARRSQSDQNVISSLRPADLSRQDVIEFHLIVGDKRKTVLMYWPIATFATVSAMSHFTSLK